MYHVTLFSKFIGKMDSTQDGDGTLLDHSLVVYGSGMSNGNVHLKKSLPYAIVSGFVKGNRHIQIDKTKDRPVGELLIDIGSAMGVQMERFGRSEARSVGLTYGLS